MKILVTGANGQLGYDVAKEFEKRNHNVIATDIEELDITDAESVMNMLSKEKVDAVVHCAAYTAVDNAEDNQQICKKVNVDGTENIAKACKKLNAKMIYISTDYVFDGQGENFYETDDETSPLNYYGLTKYQGEQKVIENVKKHFIVRISWVFGINGKNFVKTMLNLGKTRDKLTVVSDQIGSPTYTFDLAKLLADMVETEKYGIYHATNEGICSWYEFACEIFKVAGMDNVKVTPLKSYEYPTKAKRPFNSRLSKLKLDDMGFDRLPHWKDALSRYVEILKNNE